MFLPLFWIINSEKVRTADSHYSFISLQANFLKRLPIYVLANSAPLFLFSAFIGIRKERTLTSLIN
ncbi:hypothetical protein CS542_08820 [Pedobacter sp. IW39]|nr:hypothetical protein CS542_08820 [Pedobacter sp. IW39]